MNLFHKVSFEIINVMYQVKRYDFFFYKSKFLFEYMSVKLQQIHMWKCREKICIYNIAVYYNIMIMKPYINI